MSNSLSKIQIAILATIKTLTALAFLATLALATPAQSVHKDIPFVAGGHTRQVLDIHAPKDAQNMPVVFWIHGGGYLHGSGELACYGPHRLAAQGDVVVVSISYRLGALGFLAVGMSAMVCNVSAFKIRTPLPSHRLTNSFFLSCDN